MIRPSVAYPGLLRTGLALLLAGIALHVPCAADVSAAASGLAKARTSVDLLAEAGTWPPSEAKPVLDVLEQETRRFITMPSGQNATRFGEELVQILAKLHAGLSGLLNAMREEVLVRDGNLQELLATRPYRERETLALTALYHLSWARYQLSQLLSGDARAREQLLRSAVRGFTEFVFVNEIPEVYGDCLYGRALAFQALGETRRAIEDLEDVLELGSRDRTYARARSALEAVRRGEPIREKKPVDPTISELDRLEALLHSCAAPARAPAGAQEGAPEATAARKRMEAQAEALALARTLAAHDAHTAQRVDRLVRSAGSSDGTLVNFLLAELASDRGDHAAAREHYVAAARARDPDAAMYRSRARLGLAEASYRAGEHARAAQAFSDVLADDLEAGEAERALYYRFKSIEALRAEGAAEPETPEGRPEGSAEAREAYIGALGAYLERFPRGDHASELRYRLGEAHHAQGDCARALTVFGTPEGSDAWTLWARFIALQCQADATRNAWKAGEPDAERSYQASLEAARGIATAGTAAGDTALERVGAKACLVGGLLAAAAPTPQSEDVVEIVRDFEHRFPNAEDLAGDAIALRAVALACLGRADEARADVDRLLERKGDMAAWRERLRRVGRETMRQAERSDPTRRRALLAVAQRSYAALVGPADSGTAAGLTAGGDLAQRTVDLATLGQLALDLGDLDGSVRAYSRLLELDPLSLEALRGIALATEARGQAMPALGHWRAVTERTTPGETLWYEGSLHVAQMEERLGRPATACEILREARARVGLPATDELASAYAELEQRVCR